MKHDIIIVGGGAVGLFAALLLEKQGKDCALIAPLHDNDPKTTALMQPAITALKALDVFNELTKFPLRTMRLIDATKSFLKAPEIKFEASELGLSEFGYNIENKALVKALEAKLTTIKRYVSPLKSLNGTDLTLEDNTQLEANLIIGADGKNSKVRAEAGLPLLKSEYNQMAFVCVLTHSIAHEASSIEFHTNEGPLTFVPLGEKRSSLVWVMSKQSAERRKTLSQAMLVQELSAKTQNIYGKIELAPQQAYLPLSLERPQKIIAPNIALIGEAAHVLPPIGAQGMNLGLRDAAWLAQSLESYEAGSKEQLYAYETNRQSDITVRMGAVDGLNRSLLTSLPMHSLRSLAFHALDKILPLREKVMREGLSPKNLPFIMQDAG